MKDQIIVSHILNKDLDSAFDMLYNYFPTVEKYIVKNSGSKQDAKDVFQDTLLILHSKITSDDFILTSSLKTFCVAIAKNLWFKKLKEQGITQTLEHPQLIPESEDKETAYEELQNIADEALQQVSQKCRDIFKLFYYEEQNMQFIADVLGFSNEHVARTQKYKCLEAMRKFAFAHNPFK